MAQWKRAGPITQRSVDRNYALLKNLFNFFLLPCQLHFNRDHPKYLSCVPLAQRIARWTSNPKVLGSIPRWDGDIQWFVSVVVITSALHAEGRGFEPHTNLFCSINTQNDIMSGWPSGLRRQTQGNPCTLIECFNENSGPRMRAWVQIPLLTNILNTLQITFVVVQ